jgi:hypothetical protein
MKTIVFCWQQKCFNMPQTETSCFWGLGDILKGIITTYQFCKKYNYKFVLEIHDHPISRFLKYNSTSTIDTNIVPFVLDVPLFIRQNKYKDIIPFCSNSSQYDVIEEDTKEYIQKILELKEEYIIQNIKSNYSAFHFRLGDLNIKKNTDIDDKVDVFLKLLNEFSKDGDVICSDSHIFKQKISKLKPNLIILNKNVQSGHVGYEIDYEKIKTTIDDLQYLKNSSAIYAVSIYPGPSAFSAIIAACFNIPYFKSNLHTIYMV